MSERLPAQLKQRFTSEVLWHFTGRNKPEDQAYDILLSILKIGLKVGKKDTEFKYIDWKSKEIKTTWGRPTVCLADIPLKDLEIHMERYQKYAIGFHKDSVIMNHFNPVLYVNQYAHFFDRFMTVRDEICEYLKKSSKEMEVKFDEMLYLLGSVAVSGNIKANPCVNPQLDELQLNNFYYEREWRSILNWEFKPNDIAVVILPDAKVGEFIQEKRKGGLRLSDETPIIPVSMIYRF